MTLAYDVTLILLCVTFFALTIGSRQPCRLQPRRITRSGNARPDAPRHR